MKILGISQDGDLIHTSIIDEKGNVLYQSTIDNEIRLQDIINPLGSEWDLNQIKNSGKDSTDKIVAKKNLINWSFPFDSEFYSPSQMKNLSDDNYRRIKTRLGDENIKIEFPEKITTPFKTKTKFLSIPFYMLGKFTENSKPENIQIQKNNFSFSFGTAFYIYDRFGLQRIKQ